MSDGMAGRIETERSGSGWSRRCQVPCRSHAGARPIQGSHSTRQSQRRRAAPDGHPKTEPRSPRSRLITENLTCSAHLGKYEWHSTDPLSDADQTKRLFTISGDELSHGIDSRRAKRLMSRPHGRSTCPCCQSGPSIGETATWALEL